VSWYSRFLAPKQAGFVLALGGGGGRGLAHLGVLAELEAHNLRPSAIVGSSIGALFGAVYALELDAGKAIERVQSFLESPMFADLDIPVIATADVSDQSWLSRLTAAARQSILFTRAATEIYFADSAQLERVARIFCEERTFDDLMIPLYITAAEFPSGECHLFSAESKVNLHHAIAASMTIPGVFSPVTIHESRFVDGGLTSELPSDEARLVAGDNELVVAVNVGARPDPEYVPGNVIGMLDWANRVKALQLRQHEKQHADIVIEPLVGFRQWHDFSGPTEEIERGRQAAREVMPQLLRRLGR
jgi:NTE family protein